ncbi:hypothetical protein AVEN_273253-1 [Araneus ventricosus]|uniref:Uncharacterized protein n=1 Tax=Araneus ventricosus TaxID=182803 RepID=A0A4Y2K0D8_ARAVE|nr:hypothetical protein AVEN_273253-1 [Araneus ventricosus]
MTPEPALPSSSFPTTPAGGGLAVTDLTSTRPAYTAVFRWNQVSNLEPSSFYVETLPSGHRGPQMHISTRSSKSPYLGANRYCNSYLSRDLFPPELRAGVVEILGNADRAEVLANEEETATELMDIFVAKLDTLNNQNPTGELWILYFEMVTLAKHFIE